MYMISEIELNGVLELGLENYEQLLNVVNGVVECMFLCCFGYCVVFRTWKPFRNSFWVIRVSKLGFWMKKG